MKTIRVVAVAVLVLETIVVHAGQPHKIGQLTKALKRKRTRVDALWELQDFGLDAAPAVQELIRLLDARDARTRAKTADVLRTIGKDASTAIPKLVEKLGEPEPRWGPVEVPVTDVGLSAAIALGAMGEDAVIPLVDSLRDRRPRVRELAIFALGEVGPSAVQAVAPLVERLADRDKSVRRQVAWALGQIGSDASASIPELVRTLSDDDEHVRATAAEALGLIRPTSFVAVEGLIGALQDEEGDVQHEAAKALGEIGEQSVPATAALAEMLNSRGAYRYGHPTQMRPLAETAARALGAIVGGDFFAIQRLDADRYALMLADVMGHGVAAALYTMHLSQLWERYHERLDDPALFTANVNDQLAKVVKTDESFATAVCGLVDLKDHSFRFAGAGGPQVLLMHADGSYNCLESSGLPLAVMEGAAYEEVRVEIAAGDRLLLFSDGAIEIHNADGQMLDIEGLVSLLKTQGYPESNISMDALEEELLKYSNAIRLEDDLTLMEVRVVE